MQHYLHIGGGKDGLSYPAADNAETVTLPVAVTDKETYNRSTLAVGDVSITIYIHENLTPQQALNRLVEHYKAWAIDQPGGRRRVEQQSQASLVMRAPGFACLG